jgi:hypothetical protein
MVLLISTQSRSELRRSNIPTFDTSRQQDGLELVGVVDSRVKDAKLKRESMTKKERDR